jgi:hypothetical protein
MTDLNSSNELNLWPTWSPEYISDMTIRWGEEKIITAMEQSDRGSNVTKAWEIIPSVVK